MTPQEYMVINTHANEISGRKILSRIIHEHIPHIVGTNGDVQYDLATLELNNGEQVEDFCIIVIRLQQ